VLREGGAIGSSGPDLGGRNVTEKIAEEGEKLAVVRPIDIARKQIAVEDEFLNRATADGSNDELLIGDVGDAGAIGRERDFTDSLEVGHGIENGSGAGGGGNLFLRESRRREG